MTPQVLNETALRAAIAAADEASPTGNIYDSGIEAAIRAYLSASQEAAAPSVKEALLSAKFRKKPVVIDAIQWTGQNLFDIISFTDDTPDLRGSHAGMRWEDYRDLVARDGLKIFTLEGKMSASPGDWIIRGVKGEFYPCKPDIFDATYEALSSIIPATKGGEDELHAISAAIGSVRFMDPPDGGDVSLAEQVSRMRQALKIAEAGVQAARPIIEALIAQEYNVETWGLRSLLAALSAQATDGVAKPSKKCPYCGDGLGSYNCFCTGRSPA